MVLKFSLMLLSAFYVQLLSIQIKKYATFIVEKGFVN